MKPVVDGLQSEYAGRIDFQVFADVNSDRTGSVLARGQGVTAVPTMALVDPGGAELSRWVGLRPAADLKAEFDESLSP